MKTLSKKEKASLEEILLVFSKRIYRDSGMRHFSGGYARANIKDFDDDFIYIKTEFGEHNVDGATKYDDQYVMPRAVLIKDSPIENKISAIRLT
jgi:hypothetical protein